MKSVRERLNERRDREGSVPKLTTGQAFSIRALFANHPAWDDVYLFHDGHYEGGDEYRVKMTSRQSQLNAIAADGFPAVIGRGHSQIRMEWLRPGLSVLTCEPLREPGLMVPAGTALIIVDVMMIAGDGLYVRLNVPKEFCASGEDTPFWTAERTVKPPA